MTSIVTYESGLRMVATHLRSNKVILTDAPPDNHGKGEAFSPTDLAATSLATCMLTVMGIYSKENNINLQGSKAEVTKFMASNPRRISKVKIDLFMPAGIPETEKRKLEEIGINCPVAKSLHADIEQEVKFIYNK
jgi:putative redox protein